MLESIPHGLREAVALISGFGGLWIYSIVFTGAVLENLFPPTPGDTLLFAGAVLAGSGAVLWPLVLIAGITGNVLGAMLVYAFGYVRGRRYFLTHHGRWVDPDRLHRIEAWFRRYGARLIIMSRFLTGIRSVVSLAAGLGEVPALRMAVYTTISALLWNGLIVGLALAFRHNWEAISQFTMLYNRVVLGALAVAAIGWLAFHLFAGRRARAGGTRGGRHSR